MYRSSTAIAFFGPNVGFAAAISAPQRRKGPNVSSYVCPPAASIFPSASCGKNRRTMQQKRPEVEHSRQVTLQTFLNQDGKAKQGNISGWICLNHSVSFSDSANVPYHCMSIYICGKKSCERLLLIQYTCESAERRICHLACATRHHVLRSKEKGGRGEGGKAAAL
jgi:hypothetical protein